MDDPNRIYPIRIYGGKATRLGQPPSIEEAVSKIHALVDTGHPLFTKEVLRDVGRQLKNARNKEAQKISVKGLDGVIVEFDIETGDTHKSWEPGLGPLIHYESIEALTLQDFNRMRDSDRVYCNVRIYHYRTLRDISTKEWQRTIPVRSKEETEELFRTCSQAWEASTPCEQLRSTLMSVLKPTADIRKIVGFALGSMAENYLSFLGPRSAFQHALVLTLRDILGCRKHENNPREISCYTQEPIYTDLDKSVLEASGIHVLDDPEGFLEVDDSTLVVSCGPNVPVKQIVSDLARPAVMIWNTIKDKEGPMRTDPDSPRVKKFAQDFYHEIEFPGDKEKFGKLAIYIRRTEMLPKS